ncbi:MAG: oligosaccharide flippase family protein [Campylobacter hyointestinalis]
MVNLPSALISNSISQVYLQKISENKNKGIRSFALFQSTIKKLFLIAFPITILGYFLSPYIFSFVFGEKWVVSGEIVQYLFLIFLIRFCVSPLSTSLIVARELKKLAFWKYSYFITTTLFLLLLFILK